jgi:hypothetical protein
LRLSGRGLRAILLSGELERAVGAPLLLAGACRGDALDPGEPPGALTADLTRAGLLLPITLGGRPPSGCQCCTRRRRGTGATPLWVHPFAPYFAIPPAAAYHPGAGGRRTQRRREG